MHLECSREKQNPDFSKEPKTKFNNDSTFRLFSSAFHWDKNVKFT